MADKDEARSACWGFWVAVIGFIWVCLFFVYIIATSLQLQIVEPQVLSSYFPISMQDISSLHISSSGEIIAVVESPASNGSGPWMEVYAWNTTYRNSPPLILDFGKLTGKPGLPRLIPMFETAEPVNESIGKFSLSEAATGLPYAFAEDGSMIAWSWEGKLFAGPLHNTKYKLITLNPPTPLVALSIFDKNLVGVIDAGGIFRIEKLSGSNPNRMVAPLSLAGAWRISGRGPFRVLSRREAGNGVSVTTKPKPHNDTFPVSAAGTFITASTGGRVAMGTTDGSIIFPKEARPGLVLLPKMGHVQTLAFHDDQNLIASLTGDSLFLIENETSVTRMTPAPRGVRLLAISPSRIAMVTPSMIVAADLKKRLVFGEAARSKVAIMFYILSFIATVRLALVDGFKWRSLRRALELQTSASSSGNSGIEAEDFMPAQLADATEASSSPLRPEAKSDDTTAKPESC